MPKIPPHNLHPTSVGTKSITIAWSQDSGGPSIYAAKRDGTIVNPDLSGSSRSYTFSGLNANTSYSLAICDSLQTFVCGGPIEVETNPVALIRSAPTNGELIFDGFKSATFTWNKPTGYTDTFVKYVLRWYSDGVLIRTINTPSINTESAILYVAAGILQGKSLQGNIYAEYSGGNSYTTYDTKIAPYLNPLPDITLNVFVDRFEMTWDKPVLNGTFDGYNIYLYANNSEIAMMGTFNPDTLSWTFIRDALNCTTYKVAGYVDYDQGDSITVYDTKFTGVSIIGDIDPLEDDFSLIDLKNKMIEVGEPAILNDLDMVNDRNDDGYVNLNRDYLPGGITYIEGLRDVTGYPNSIAPSVLSNGRLNTCKEETPKAELVTVWSNRRYKFVLKPGSFYSPDMLYNDGVGFFDVIYPSNPTGRVHTWGIRENNDDEDRTIVFTVMYETPCGDFSNNSDYTGGRTDCYVYQVDYVCVARTRFANIPIAFVGTDLRPKVDSFVPTYKNVTKKCAGGSHKDSWARSRTVFLAEKSSQAEQDVKLYFNYFSDDPGPDVYKSYELVYRSDLNRVVVGSECNTAYPTELVVRYKVEEGNAYLHSTSATTLNNLTGTVIIPTTEESPQYGIIPLIEARFLWDEENFFGSLQWRGGVWTAIGNTVVEAQYDGVAVALGSGGYVRKLKYKTTREIANTFTLRTIKYDKIVSGTPVSMRLDLTKNSHTTKVQINTDCTSGLRDSKTTVS